MEKIIVIAGGILLLASLWYFCSRSESSLRKKLNKHLEWLRFSESSDGKQMMRSIKDELKRHDKREMLNKHKKARKLLDNNVPCYHELRKKGPMASRCSDCTVQSSCMLCKPQKKF